MENRETRKFWAITDFYDIKQVEGQTCKPNNPDYWWVPSLGYSMCEGHSLFQNKGQAVEKAMKDINSEIIRLQETLNRLGEANGK